MNEATAAISTIVDSTRLGSIPGNDYVTLAEVIAELSGLASMALTLSESADVDGATMGLNLIGRKLWELVEELRPGKVTS